MEAFVIDDSRTMRMMLRNILRDLGFEVADAENGKVALEALAARNVPDLVLIDWNMPELPGIEVVRQLRGEERFSTAKLMMVTTETGLGRMVEALEVGADEYLMKPFTKDALREKLQIMGIQVDSSPEKDPTA